LRNSVSILLCQVWVSSIGYFFGVARSEVAQAQEGNEKGNVNRRINRGTLRSELQNRDYSEIP
jgi:hypothetical protein